MAGDVCVGGTPYPHALVVGRGFRDGGAVGGGAMLRQQQQLQQHSSHGGGMLRQQQQLQQHWPRDGGMPRQQQLQQHWPRDGGMPRQQQQQQQHWSRGGGMPWQQQQQQQWSRGSGIPHEHQRSSHAFPPARQARQQQPSRVIPTIGGNGEDGSSPLSETFFGGNDRAVEELLQSENVEMPMFSLLEGPQQSAPTAVALAAAAPAAEAMTGTRVFPDVSSKGVAEAPTSSAGAASAVVPAAAPATGGTVFPTTSVGGAARAPASADETAVLFPRLHHLGGQSGRASRLLERRHRTWQWRRHRRPAILLPLMHRWRGRLESSRQQLHPLSKSAARGGRPPTPLIPVQCFHWRSATTKAARYSMAVAAVVRVTAAAATTTTAPVTTTHGGIQPVLELCCVPLIRENYAGEVRGEQKRF